MLSCHAPRGAGIERAVAVCRHLTREGARVLKLVTDESMSGDERRAAKSGFEFLLISTKLDDTL